MDIIAFGADDAAQVVAWVELENAISARDAPWTYPVTPTIGVGRFRHGWDGEPSTPYLARVDGTVVGWGQVATSEYDNLDLAWVGAAVHPDHRRRGHGSAILAAMIDEAGRRGRTSIGTDSWDAPGPVAFAAHHGFTARLVNVNRRQFLAEVDWPALDAAYDASLPHAGDYRFEKWTFPSPESELARIAALAESINDAPLDDLDYEDEVYSVDRMRAYEQACLAQNQRMYRMVARHRPTGALAAHTVVAVEADHPTRGHQHDTAVDRDHRGHRLGLLLKTEMMRWLREDEPQLAEIDTWNAESNGHMIGVNRVLGYRVMGREIAYQR